MVSFPTFYSQLELLNTATVIDIIYGNNFDQDSHSGNILIKFADHFSQFISINKEITKYILKMITHCDRLFRKTKEDPLNQHIKLSYNLFCNRITREIKKAKWKYFKNTLMLT